MFMQRMIGKGDADKVFISATNNFSTSPLSNGQVVVWDFNGTKDGIGVTRPTARATNAGLAVAGVVAQTIAYQGLPGYIQTYGYHAAVRMRSMTGGAPPAVPGRPLTLPAAGGVFCAESMATAAGAAVYPFGFALGSTTGWTTAPRPAFIKAM